MGYITYKVISIVSLDNTIHEHTLFIEGINIRTTFSIQRSPNYQAFNACESYCITEPSYILNYQQFLPINLSLSKIKIQKYNFGHT